MSIKVVDKIVRAVLGFNNISLAEGFDIMVQKTPLIEYVIQRKVPKHRALTVVLV
jgi:hypothetical protein